MNAEERMKAILNWYGLNAKTLSERLGMERAQAIYDILSGKTKSVTEKMASKIISEFSDISKSWLLSGEGSMLKQTPSPASDQAVHSEGPDGQKTKDEIIALLKEENEQLKKDKENLWALVKQLSEK